MWGDDGSHSRNLEGKNDKCCNYMPAELRQPSGDEVWSCFRVNFEDCVTSENRYPRDYPNRYVDKQACDEVWSGARTLNRGADVYPCTDQKRLLSA